MTSEESDDEPLAVLAAAKKLNPEKFQFTLPGSPEYHVKRKKTKQRNLKQLPITMKICRKTKNNTAPTEIKRPADVWMYLKDLKPTGPYSCLLCSDWFINRSKILLHYILNHRKDWVGFRNLQHDFAIPKDYCGICRYFITDREAWWKHQSFHIPWPCSQCIENFPSEQLLRQHLSVKHNLVHCRLCHFQISDDEHYNKHLFQKHNTINVTMKDVEVPWELEYEGSNMFHCLLCSKSDILCSTFFNHYMGYHHFTLKCLATIICGRDPPFTVAGADISAEFVERMKDQTQFGYVDLEQNLPTTGNESDHSENDDANELIKALIPEVKQEVTSEPDGEALDVKKDEEMSDPDVKIKKELINTYRGDEDFDVTLMELILLQRNYYDYVEKTLNDMNSNVIPTVSDIDYGKIQLEMLETDCPLCKNKFNAFQNFASHMGKMHGVKSIPAYSCRVCVATFESQNELDNHVSEEIGNFEDLWICQFCDREFDNRAQTRHHLTEHWDFIEYDNCFSPHLGFKCRYCPTLFWNETDRETHQVRVHFGIHKDDYYKCETCSEIFSDKIWFIHHYLEKHHNVGDKEPQYMLKCCLCCLVVTSVDDMRRHFGASHPEARKIFCSLDSCQYKPLRQRKSFKLHVKTIHDPTGKAERAVRCGVCGRDFPSGRSCSAHAAQVHGPGKFKCSLCKEVMHTMDERKLHYLIRHPGHHPFECRDCGKSFLYKSSLYMHRQEHTHAKQTYTCSFCGKVFAKKDSFREHVQIHDGPRHACSYCPMRFVQRSNMLRHERRHTGERPYQCPHCARAFADKGACTSHARTHSKDTSYACVYCGQTFIQKSKLTYHIRKHTGENLESCKVCSKLFTSACSLREHMKTHVRTNDSIKCPLCDKKYKDERCMLRHLRTTHTRGNFACPRCPKTLSSPSGLRYHVITHSPLNTFRCKCCSKSSACKRTMIRHLRRRHNFKGNEVNIKDYYTRMDPRDCKLGLDEVTLTTIFGPPKKTVNIIGDFIQYSDKINNPNKANDDESDDDNSKESDKESERDSEVDREYDAKDEGELEPTDFVSVKIEPFDEIDAEVE